MEKKQLSSGVVIRSVVKAMLTLIVKTIGMMMPMSRPMFGITNSISQAIRHAAAALPFALR